MIRHKAIARLSRDHHRALVQAMAMKRVDDQSVAGVAAGFVDFFDNDAQRHFEIEEQVLVPMFLEFAGLGHAEDSVLGQVLREHAEIRAFVQTLRRGGAATETVRELGRRLDAHVRLEERRLFPMIQDLLSEEQLDELAAAMDSAEQA